MRDAGSITGGVVREVGELAAGLRVAGSLHLGLAGLGSSCGFGNVAGKSLILGFFGSLPVQPTRVQPIISPRLARTILVDKPRIPCVIGQPPRVSSILAASLPLD
jgi:hypothetical protein